METPTPLSVENISSKNNEKFKSKSNYIINSNKNNCFNIFIRNLTSFKKLMLHIKMILKRKNLKKNFHYLI